MNDVFRKRVRLNMMELLVSVSNNNPVSIPCSSELHTVPFIHSFIARSSSIRLSVKARRARRLPAVDEVHGEKIKD